MPKLLIIRGYSASGKTTVAREFAKKHKFQLIEYDTFFFGLNRHRNFIKSDFLITFETVVECVKKCMKYKRDIILEGALAPIDKRDPFDIIKITSLAKKNKYKLIKVLFIVNKNISEQRMKKRKGLVNDETYNKIIKQINKTKSNDEIVIDTSNINIHELILRLEKILKI